MADSVQERFMVWLKPKLRELNADDIVFSSYICGILDAEETEEEKREALSDILSQIVLSETDKFVETIYSKWEECSVTFSSNKKLAAQSKVDDYLAALLEPQKLVTTNKERQYTDDEKQIRERILANYSQTEVTDDENDFDADDGNTVAVRSTGAAIEKNTNFQDVLALQKGKREKARLVSAAKKQKDKEDRDKQKQLREEKKEKRKTVKGERRR